MSTLAASTSTIVIAAVAAVAVIALVLIIVAPWHRVRAEPPLDPEVEAALLLGEDPDEIEVDVPRSESPGA